jgi:hypothetical protein
VITGWTAEACFPNLQTTYLCVRDQTGSAGHPSPCESFDGIKRPESESNLSHRPVYNAEAECTRNITFVSLIDHHVTAPIHGYEFVSLLHVSNREHRQASVEAGRKKP